MIYRFKKLITFGGKIPTFTNMHILQMRYPVIILLLTASISPSFGQKNKKQSNNFPNFEPINGKAKQFDLAEYIARDSSGTYVRDKQVATATLTFWADGTDKIKVTKTAFPGEKQFIDTTWYDEKGNTTQKKEYKTDGSLKVDDKFYYDANGNKLRELRISPGKDTIVTTWEYDNKGNNTEMKEKSAYGMDKTFYKYDDKGNQIEYTAYNNNEVSGKAVNKYDDKNQLIETYQPKFSEYIPAFTTKFKYNGKGQLTEFDRYNDSNKPVRTTVQKFDSKGNQVEKTETDYENGSTRSGKMTCQYEYDSQGNWTKAMLTDPNNNVVIFIRKIFYR